MRIVLLLAASAAALVSPPASSQSSDGVGAMYRCPGNDYSNTITASEAEKLHCKKVENAAVTVIQSLPSAAPASAAPASATASAPAPALAPRPAPVTADVMNPAESAALRTRASNARRNLEGRLKSEEKRLATLEQEFNGGEPERQLEEIDLPRYLDRVARMRSAIARKQIEIAELRREMDKLPTP